MGSIERTVETAPGPAGSELRLRNARAADLDAVAALLGEVYAEFRGHLPPEAWARYIGEIVDVRSRLGVSELVLAEREERLVGTIGFYPDASRSVVERWPEGWASIRALGVRAGARRQGVGAALTHECLRRARVRGAKAIGLHTASHMIAATRLYERLGFRRAPELDLEIGKMFGGQALPPGQSWQAQAYQLDLEGVLR
jgi:ribosomal protein S18 acetylase RimI-like enzyme